MFTFEEKIEDINLAIAKIQSKFTLKARADIEFQDVAQIIRLHIFQKFNQWDQRRPITPWLNKIVHNQFVNILRNIYSGMSRPCLRCPAALDDVSCSIFITQCSKCPLFAKWEKTKKKKSDVCLPVSIENHTDAISESPSYELNFDKAIPTLNKRLKNLLKPTEWQYYELMYIENKSEAEVVKIMDFRNTEKKAKHRYKRMDQIDQIVQEKARKILEEYGIEN